MRRRCAEDAPQIQDENQLFIYCLLVFSSIVAYFLVCSFSSSTRVLVYCRLFSRLRVFFVYPCSRLLSPIFSSTRVLVYCRLFSRLLVFFVYPCSRLLSPIFCVYACSRLPVFSSTRFLVFKTCTIKVNVWYNSILFFLFKFNKSLIFAGGKHLLHGCCCCTDVINVVVGVGVVGVVIVGAGVVSVVRDADH